MSYYTTTAVPPTSGPLPVVERASLSSGPYGGGGGGGPNPVVSSLSVNPTGQINLRNNGNASFDVADAVLAFDWDSTPNITSILGYDPTISSLRITTKQGVYSDSVPTALVGPILSTLALNVSSINGAAPGGSAGPDPVVSSLTFSTTGAINMTGQLVIQDSTTPVVQDYLFQTNEPASSLGALSSFLSTANLFAVTGPGGDGNNGTIAMLASADGRALLQSGVGDSKSTLTLYADSVNVPFNLNVSSINGAAPGGSAGPNPVVSTITFNNASVLNNLSSITPYPQALTISDGLGGAAVEFNLANADAILSIIASGGNGGSLSAIANDVDLIIQSAGGNNNIVIDGPTTTISSLTVSSINGGAPALTSLFSTLFAANPSLSSISL